MKLRVLKHAAIPQFHGFQVMLSAEPNANILQKTKRQVVEFAALILTQQWQCGDGQIQ